MKLRTSYALKEGGDRDFAISTTRLDGGERVERIVWQQNTGRPPFELVEGTEESRPAPTSCCSRWGSSAPSRGCSRRLGVDRDARSNVAAPAFATSRPGVFAAGDARRGQSLIVWAIDEGRRCAQATRDWLDGRGARRSEPTVSGGPQPAGGGE